MSEILPYQPVKVCLPRRLGLMPNFLLLSSVVIWPSALSAQSIDTYFPQGISGYEQQLGVTVITRMRPLYDPLGVQIGDFLIRPRLDQSLFYNSSVTSGGLGSWGGRTSASVSAGSGWRRDSLAAMLSIDHYQFFSLPQENYTDFNIGLSAGYTIADSQATVSYSHQSYHQLGATIGAARSDLPVSDQADTAQIDYTLNFSRLALTPTISATAYRYGEASRLGVNFSQAYLNNNVVAAGITARYSLSEEGGLLVVARGLNSSYTTPQAAEPSPDSKTFLLLGGIDYQAHGLWRYRLLAGLEVRAFAASRYGTHTAPNVEGSVIWTPTGLTTFTGTIANSIEAPQTAGTSGYTLSQAKLVLDHEYRRNIFFQGRGGVQRAQFLDGGGTQTNFTGGGGITWLMNRGMRLTLDYDYTRQSGSGAADRQAVINLQYNQNLVTLALHLAL